MVSLGFKRQIAKWVLEAVDKKFGKIKIGGISVDKITDIFQGQDNKIKELEREIEAIKSYLKDITNG